MKSLPNIAVALLLLLFAASLGLNGYYYTTRKGWERADTLRVTYIDTVRYYKPVPRDSIVKRYVTVKLPAAPSPVVPVPKPLPEKTEAAPSTQADSVEVTLPITQTVYRDTAYTAYVSGYRARLDSLLLHRQHEVITIVKHSKPRRWNLGLQAGYGITLHSRPQAYPYIGIGISYNLFSF